MRCMWTSLLMLICWAGLASASTMAGVPPRFEETPHEITEWSPEAALASAALDVEHETAAPWTFEHLIRPLYLQPRGLEPSRSAIDVANLGSPGALILVAALSVVALRRRRARRWSEPQIVWSRS